MAHRKRNSMEVKLLSWTTFPFKLIHNLFWHDKHGIPIGSIKKSATKKEFEFVLQLLKEDWCGLTEMPTFVFQMVLPRSLHAQIRAHRHMSFFSESHQLHQPDYFAEDKDYFQIPNLNNESYNCERLAMLKSQKYYCTLRKAGVLPSLARGVLPMHINLGLTVGLNLRTLFNVVVKRRCHILQGTYWNPLLKNIEYELCKKIDTRFAKLFNLRPCDISKHCLSSIEEKLRIQGRDPHTVCPRYEKLRTIKEAL